MGLKVIEWSSRQLNQVEGSCMKMKVVELFAKSMLTERESTMHVHIKTRKVYTISYAVFYKLLNRVFINWSKYLISYQFPCIHQTLCITCKQLVTASNLYYRFIY